MKVAFFDHTSFLTTVSRRGVIDVSLLVLPSQSPTQIRSLDSKLIGDERIKLFHFKTALQYNEALKSNASDDAKNVLPRFSVRAGSLRRLEISHSLISRNKYRGFMAVVTCYTMLLVLRDSSAITRLMARVVLWVMEEKD